jgi:hypothetical protein
MKLMAEQLKKTKNLRDGVFLWMTQPPVGKTATGAVVVREASLVSVMFFVLPLSLPQFRPVTRRTLRFLYLEIFTDLVFHLEIQSMNAAVVCFSQMDFMAELLRFHVMEANAFTSDLLQKYDFDVFDVHYYMCYVTDL